MEGVKKGTIITGKPIQQAVSRHFQDLHLSKKKSYQFRFDPELADRAIKFISKLKLTGEANKHFILEPWQAWVVAMTFGWVEKKTGFRRFKRVLLKVARKNGKSELAGAIALYALMADGYRDPVTGDWQKEWAAEVYSIATKKDQAKIVFDKSKSMLNKLRNENIRIRQLTGVHKLNLHVLSTESKMEPVPANSDKLDGLGASWVMVDEYHAHIDDSLVQVMETGQGHRKQPMVFIASTSGPNINGPCRSFEKVCSDILDGIIDDPRIFAAMYHLDEDDDWKDRKNWPKANPNMGISVSEVWMEDQFRKAQTSISAENNFKTKNLNVWVSTGTSWIRDEDWMKHSTQIHPEELTGRPAYLALDLSRKNDLTIKLNLFPPFADDREFKILMKTYCPMESVNIRSRRDRVPYLQWEHDGHITGTLGPTVDYEMITKDIKDDAEKYDIRRLEYDETFSYDLIPKIKEMGIECFNYPQNCKNMNPPIDKIEELVKEGLLNHGNNPVLRWNVKNVVLYVDTNGWKRFDKRKIQERIDGAVALAMAMGGYLTEPPIQTSKYESEELTSI